VSDVDSLARLATGAVERDRTRIALRLSALVVALTVWEAVAGAMGILVAPPSSVAGSLWTGLVVEGTLRRAILSALSNAAVGYALAVAVGVPLGVAMGLVGPLRAALDPVVDALYATPMVALAPLFIVWFGFSGVGKVTLVFTFAVFVVLVNVESGVRDTPEGLLRAARVFGAGPLTVYRIHLRYALPQVATGLRLGAGRAVRGMVAAELFLYADELGAYLIDSGATFRVADLLAGVVALSALGVAALAAVGGLERAIRVR
jgi:NitT/TauT family transport system permease protein